MLVWAPRELELRTHGPGFRGVQDQPGRARARRNGQLEVADVHVEPGQVEGGSASRELGLGSHFVVPSRLVLPGRRDRAIRGQVLGLAQRRVEGIVDPAKDRKSTRLNSSHGYISYAVFCLKKKKKKQTCTMQHI